MAVPIYPNLAADLNPTGIGQMWLADITYIRLETDFVYLAGALERTLEDDLTMASAFAKPPGAPAFGASLGPRLPVRLGYYTVC
jgi:hypothetical protein